MRSYRRYTGLAACLTAVLLAAMSGCRRESADTSQEKALRIAVIPKATNHEYWKSVHAGALKAEQELAGVQVIWSGPAKENDRDQQIAVVENQVNAGVSGIVLAPLDEVALARPVREAMAAKVPVVIMDSGLQATPGTDYVSFVATDNFTAGQQAGRELGTILNGKGKVIVLRYLVGSASTTEREEGLLQLLTGEFPDIQIVSSDQHAGPTTESAYAKAENLLARFPDVDAVFAPCEPPLFGVLRVLQDSGRAGQVRLIGFDTSAKLVQGMRDGQIHALVLQDPINIGYRAVKTLVAHLRGRRVAERIDTGSWVARPDNMDEPRIQELLNPPLDRYLR
ncbi:MAG: ABC transporter substrate-binding protein [Phycisphaerae bacterium]|nr:ABC transporter substrate-binding protein [Phycisphaerae bacterium]